MTHAPVGSRSSAYSRSYSTGYRGSLISGVHAPVGTGQCSMLNGRTYTRLSGNTSGNTTCAYWAAPASFEHADKTREAGDAQRAEGAKQIYDSVSDAVTNPEPAGTGGIFAGLANLFGGSQKHYDANAEMMQAARDQIDANRGRSPDAMNHVESNMGSGGETCVIA